MDLVYGDHVHQNDGTHLNGGIADDPVWQVYWRRLVVLPPQQYTLPKGALGKRFIHGLLMLLGGVISRKWNLERFFVYQTVVLQRTKDVKTAKDIKNRIKSRLDAWDGEKFDMLVQTTVRDMTSNLSDNPGSLSVDDRVKIFQKKMFSGDIRGAVKFLTQTEIGDVLQPTNTDEKSGLSVEAVLNSKHPDARIPEVSEFPKYANLPDFVDLDITSETVNQVAGVLRGSAGLGGTDVDAVSLWLLQHGEASAKLRSTFADFCCWMANTFPPWAAYRALMAGRLIALNKFPGVRPIGIGKTWRRLGAKCVLKIAGSEAKEACGTDQLCAGLEAAIEGGIHATKEWWDVHRQEEDYGFLLIDARNAFNEQNRTKMLYTVRHEWPSGSRFVFNCYKHYAILVIRGKDAAAFLFSKEGVTQGNPLAMVCYGTGFLPLIRQLKVGFSTAKQQWYADDSGIGSTLKIIEACL